MSNTRWSVGFESVLVVVGHNSENADMDNPRGEEIRERFYALAEDVEGNRRVWGGYHESPELAEAEFVALAPPVEFWEDIRPAYGSDAYAKNAFEYEAELIEWEREQDLWAPAFRF